MNRSTVVILIVGAMVLSLCSGAFAGGIAGFVAGRFSAFGARRLAPLGYRYGAPLPRPFFSQPNPRNQPNQPNPPQTPPNQRNAPPPPSPLGQAQVVVVEVVRDSPAAQGGLQVNDVIVSFEGQTITNQAQLTSLIGQRQAGDLVTLQVRRNNELRTFNIKLGANPTGGTGAYLGVRLILRPINAPVPRQSN